MSIYTPLNLEVLMHCHLSSEPHKNFDAPPEEIKDPIIEHSVGIGLGNGCSAGLSLKNELLINFFNHETRASKQINFGYRTRAQVDELLGYIGHLKIHLPE